MQEYGIVAVSDLLQYPKSEPYESSFKFPYLRPNYVDLGLPSGTLWADANVGANYPEEAGHLFAWGETEPKTTYDWSNYKWSNGSPSTLTKYCAEPSQGYNGFVDNITELEAMDDAAVQYLGDEWMMPTSEQIAELFENCTLASTTKNGVSGHLLTSNISGYKGKTIFLPYVSSGYNSSSYWGKTLAVGGSSFARGWDIRNNVASNLTIGRQTGLPIRPVYVGNSGM